ncbi:transposon Ty3-I Gag-Pol polyprotein [Trichonephila clavata]|uniref:Transposon Ty3-I Gag-Pol polyprotein n=1 Tax=Trichonephila clavata TaxID=2740835 RepID=A0A8X6GPD5_TRICU|nr:transposon Ty3-I Gag-Pol polyprotein [Trichonephila clavata]
MQSDDSQIARIAVKLPPIWTNNIKLWFVHSESNFALSAITNDQTKYNNIIVAIDPETLSSVSDILFKPPATNKYNDFKERLIAEFSDSANKQIRKLLSELQLGDDKPSHLLRKMRVLASGSSLNDNFLKTLWLQRLPSEMQSILSVSSETLENLAKLADKIAEVRTDPFLNVSVMDKSTSSNPALPTNPREDLPNPLYQEVVALRQQVDALRQQFQRFSGWKSRNRSRTRSNFSRNTTRSLEREGSSEICYYHSKFSRHAKRCRSPYSGSDVSCTPVPEMFKKLSPEPLQLFAANNSKILTYGSKLLNIDLGLRRKFSWKFLIASVPIPIIGADFLENFGLLVDLKRRKLIDSVTTLSISGISAATDIISVKLISGDTYYHRLLSNFPDLIKLTPKRKQACHNTVHYIETTGPPIHSKPRRLSPKIHEAVKHEFQFMLEQVYAVFLNCRGLLHCLTTCPPGALTFYRVVGVPQSVS